MPAITAKLLTAISLLLVANASLVHGSPVGITDRGSGDAELRVEWWTVSRRLRNRREPIVERFNSLLGNPQRNTLKIRLLHPQDKFRMRARHDPGRK